MLKDKIILLSNVELNTIHIGLGGVLTGYDAFSEKGMFKIDKDKQFICQQFEYGNELFFNRIMRVCDGVELGSFYIIRYSVSENKPNLMFEEGYLVSKDISYEEFRELGDSIMFNVNGTAFFYADPTFSWCIATDLDVQLLYGDTKFINKYFENHLEKIKVISDFQEFLNEPKRKNIYKRLNKFIQQTVRSLAQRTTDEQ